MHRSALRSINLLSVIGVVGALTAFAGNASATVTVCNRSSQDFVFDYVRSDSSCGSNAWTDSGWYFIQVNHCANVYSGSASQLSFWWTAAGATLTWGDINTQWIEPNVSHTWCFDFDATYCDGPNASCRTSPHWGVAFSNTNVTLNVKNGNTFSVQ